MANQYSSRLGLERKAAVKVLQRGLATVAEIAAVYGLQRQTVQHWADCMPDDFSVATARDAAVRRALHRFGPKLALAAPASPPSAPE